MVVVETVHPEWLTEKKINTIVQYVVRRNSELADVPAVVDLAENDSQRRIPSLFCQRCRRCILKSMVAAPGLSSGVLQAQRAAFDATMTDRDFLEDVRKSGVDFDPMPGAPVLDPTDERGWETGHCRMAQVTTPILNSLQRHMTGDWRRVGSCRKPCYSIASARRRARMLPKAD